jgi:hypothetical protein
VKRVFATTPNWATLSYTVGGDELLRAIQPEARFTLDGANFSVGSIDYGTASAEFGTPFVNKAYINRTTLAATAATDPAHFQYLFHSVVPVEKRYDWTPGIRHSSPNVAWPAKGKGLKVTFGPPTAAMLWTTAGSFATASPSTNASSDTFTLPATRAIRGGGKWRVEVSADWNGYQPMISEIEFRVGGKWVTNSNGGAGMFNVTASSGYYPNTDGGGG